MKAALAGLLGALLLVSAGSASAKPGDVYVGDLGGGGDGHVWKLGPGGGDATSIATAAGFSAAGMVLEPSGNLLATDYGSGPQLWQVNPLTGAISTFLDSPPLSDPQDVALAPDGAILVSDRDAGPGATPIVFRVDPTTKAMTTVAFGPPFDFTVRGLAAKRDGTIFVAGLDSVFEISPSGVVTTLVPSTPMLSGASGVALTPDERTLFVAAFDATPNQIVRVDTATGAATTFAPFSDVISVAILPDRSLLASNDSAGIVYRVPPSGSPVTTFSDDPDLAVGELGDIVVEPARCGGKLPTVVGTTGKDVLRGSTFADVFSVLGGRDSIRAVAGNDTMCGGKGKDRLVGGRGRDRLVGGRGRDRLVGGAGRDRLVGGPGPDVCIGGTGRDRLRSC